MNESLEVAVKAVLSAVGVALVLLDERVPARWRAWVRRGLVAVTGVAVAAYFNFSALHGGGRLAHNWEQFHYFLGSKYFAELGYDGLYVASMGAEMQSLPGKGYQPFLRDLRSNQVVPTPTLDRTGFDVYRRFTPERWSQFKRDNFYFLSQDPVGIGRARLDHGYNPSPAWTFVAQLFDADLPAQRETTAWLGLLDVILLALAFGAVFRVYGARVGLLALLVFATGYAWRFYWTGGAFLRHDWLAAVIVGVCMLRRERYRLAGALLGYAAMVRIFPAVFVVGLAAQALHDLLRRRSLRWARRFAAGLLVAVALLFGAGCLAGRGVAAWAEFGRNLRKHQATWLTNNVGLRDVVLYDGATYERRLVHWDSPEPWIEWQTHMDERMRRLAWPLWSAAALLVALAAWRAWRARRDQAMAAGLVVVYALAAVTCYYWGMLVLALARRPRATAAALLVLNLGLCLAHFASPVFELRYGLMSWGLLAFFAWWTLAGDEELGAGG